MLEKLKNVEPATTEKMEQYQFSQAVDDITAELVAISMIKDAASLEAEHLDETLDRYRKELGQEAYETAVQVAMMDFYHRQFRQVENLYPDGYKVSLAGTLRLSLQRLDSIASTDSLGQKKTTNIEETVGGILETSKLRIHELGGILDSLIELGVLDRDTKIADIKGILDVVIGGEVYGNPKHKEYYSAKAHLSRMTLKIADALQGGKLPGGVAHTVAGIMNDNGLKAWERADEL